MPGWRTSGCCSSRPCTAAGRRRPKSTRVPMCRPALPMHEHDGRVGRKCAVAFRRAVRELRSGRTEARRACLWCSPRPRCASPAIAFSRGPPRAAEGVKTAPTQSRSPSGVKVQGPVPAHSDRVHRTNDGSGTGKSGSAACSSRTSNCASGSGDAVTVTGVSAATSTRHASSLSMTYRKSHEPTGAPFCVTSILPCPAGQRRSVSGSGVAPWATTLCDARTPPSSSA